MATDYLIAKIVRAHKGKRKLEAAADGTSRYTFGPSSDIEEFLLIGRSAFADFKKSREACGYTVTEAK